MLIDGEQLVYQLFQRDLPDVDIAAEVDTSTVDHFPIVMFRLSGTGKVTNGNGLWDYLLTVTVLAEGGDAGYSLCQQVHQAVEDWPYNPGVGAAWVTYSEYLSLPSRVSTSMVGGRNVHQFEGTYSLLLRNLI